MIIALAIAAAEPAMTAIDAERAFAADAQKLGQWTAFRKYAADDAEMFVPQWVRAHEFLKDKADPPVSVFWWPGKSFVSCDGGTAVNTGPWVRQWGKTVGYFSTVWKRQADGGWKWIYDGGDALEAARAEGGDIKPKPASCEGKPFMMPHAFHSADSTLAWINVTGPDGQRSFFVWLWNGEKYENVISDYFAAPPK